MTREEVEGALGRKEIRQQHGSRNISNRPVGYSRARVAVRGILHWAEIDLLYHPLSGHSGERVGAAQGAHGLGRKLVEDPKR